LFSNHKNIIYFLANFNYYGIAACVMVTVVLTKGYRMQAENYLPIAAKPTLKPKVAKVHTNAAIS